MTIFADLTNDPSHTSGARYVVARRPWSYSGGEKDEMIAADASLLTAAPDLLAALQLIVEQGLLDPRQSVHRDALNRAVTAIAAATGATP